MQNCKLSALMWWLSCTYNDCSHNIIEEKARKRIITNSRVNSNTNQNIEVSLAWLRHSVPIYQVKLIDSHPEFLSVASTDADLTTIDGHGWFNDAVIHSNLGLLSQEFATIDIIIHFASISNNAAMYYS